MKKRGYLQYGLILGLIVSATLLAIVGLTMTFTRDKAMDYFVAILNSLIVIFSLYITITETNRNTVKQVNYQKYQEEAEQLERVMSEYITDIWKYFYDCRHQKEADRSQAIGIYNLIRLKYAENKNAENLISILKSIHDLSSRGEQEEMEKLELSLFDETRKLSKIIRDYKYIK